MLRGWANQRPVPPDLAYNHNSKQIFSTPALSGSRYSKYTLPEGRYRATQFIDTTAPEFSRKGVGFKVVIGPDRYDPYKGDVRTLLRIHPARGNATEGCIGLQTNSIEELESLERIFKTSLLYNNSIPLGVSILNR